MNADILRRSAREDSATEVSILIEYHGKRGIQGTNAFGIKFIEEGIRESTVDKEKKLQLLDVFMGLPAAPLRELQELKTVFAAQQEMLTEMKARVDLLTGTMAAFAEAAQKKQENAAQKPSASGAAAARRKPVQGL